MEEIPIEVHGLSRAIFSTLLNYPVTNRNGKIMLTIYRNNYLKEHGCLPNSIARTLTARRICLGRSKSSILI